MIYRWLTSRSRDEDVPASPQSRGGVERLLEEQHAQSPKEEVFEGRTRPDTYTWHNGLHRGVVWMDKERTVLWLLCFADGHDAGYALGHELADADPEKDRLYPRLDPDFAGGEAVGAWTEFVDDDMLEWLRLLDGAATAFEPIREGKMETAECTGPVALIRIESEEGLYKFTIRRLLTYESPDRDRYLEDEEMFEIVRQLMGDPAADFIEPHVPPFVYGFVNFYVVGDLLSAREWLQCRMDEVTQGHERRGVDPTRV